MKNTLVQGNLHCLKYFVPKKKLHYCKFYTVQNYTVRGIAVFGFYAVSKEDACLLITHAVFMSINFCILLAAIISSIRLIFYIQTGLFEANVTEDMNMYEINSWVRYRWDTLQCKYVLCNVYAN